MNNVLFGWFLECICFYIYDTHDSSCEMVLHNDLEKSGVDYKSSIDFGISFSKFKMLCGLHDFSCYVFFPLCIFRYDISDLTYVLEVIIFCGDRCRRYYREHFVWLYRTFGCSGDYFCFLYLKGNDRLKIPEFMFLEYYNNWSVMSVGNIMLLPPVMIPYIMSLVNSCSFEKLSQALNFGSIENFYIHSCESEGFKKPRCLYTDWISQEWKCR